MEADFCGDRLRLHAFLRVVHEGIPERPARFRRRIQTACDDIGASNYLDSDRTDTIIALSQQDISDKPSNDASVFDIVRSPTPEQALHVPEESLPDTSDHNGFQEIGDQTDHAQLPLILRVDRSVPSPIKVCKTSSTRKRRRLPANELALLRTTSSDGLPQPSVRYQSA